MTSYSWATNTSGDWNTGTLWSSGTVPNDVTADVTIDAATTLAAYTVTIAQGESFTIDSLTMNNTDPDLGGANSNPYVAAELTLDGTLAFAPGSAGVFGNAAAGGSLQTYVFTDPGANAELINVGTIDGFIQVQGNMLLTGTNGIYITNDLQAQGTVTIDTKSIAEMTGNTLFDGIYQAVGPAAATINLGGTLEGLIVNVATLEGPQLNTPGWTELTFNGPDTVIDEWNGTAYVPIESTLTEISGGGTVDVLTGRDYTTANTLTVDHNGASDGPGMLNLAAGTVTTGGLVINGGIVQGNATIVGNVANNGTVMALGGTLDLTGSLTGTGSVGFDFDSQQGTLDATGATLVVNSVSAGQMISMNGDDTLVLDTPATFAGVIGANVGDRIVLTGVTATSAVLNGGTLLVFDGTQTVASLAVSGTYTGDHVAVSGSTLTVAAGTAVPTITGTVAGQTTTTPATVTPFAHVVIGDPNVGQAETVTVTLSTAANGVLSNLGGGSYNATTGVYTDAGSVAAVTTALDGLVFTPTLSQVAPGQTVTTGFTINDVDTGLASATDGTTTVIATSGTLAPTVSGTVAGQAVPGTGTIAPFAGVVIGDANIGQTETVTVTLSAAANGVLTNLGGGSYNAATGVYLDTGSAAAVTTALDGLVFTAAAQQGLAPGQTVTTGFTIADVDTALASATDSKTSVIATTATAPLTITGTVAGQAVMDDATIAPFSGVVIGDSNFAQSETLTVTLSSAANGTLTNLGGGTYNATTGVYTDSGSASAVTSALDGLVFVPTAQQVPPGQTVNTGFTITDVDTASVTATDSTTSVTATAAPLPIKNFTITDTTTGIATTAAGTAYSGPVAGLQNEFITTTSDSLAITATAPNSFIHTGSGEDAIDVSHVNGTNVLDGSTGSNFLVGGTGFDTFFLDDRNPASDVFSTVVNFHSGDNATVWGVTPSDFTLNTYNNQGAAGYKGLDFSFTAPGKPDANLVLTGFSTADLTNGKLTVTYGTTPTTDGIAGSTYMLIHAN